MKRLGDFVKLQGGYAFKSTELSDDMNDNPVIKIGNITGGHFVSLDKYQTVSDKVFEKSKSYHTKPDDILIAMTGANVGKVSRVPINFPACGINQRVGRFVLKDSCKYSSDFIYYLVSSPRSYEYFSRVADGAAQPNISGSLIENLEFLDIEIDKANKFAKILKDLDNKIQLNTQTNQTLEAIAQAIFKSWFIDFDPVKAKAQAINEGKTTREANLAAMAVISGKAVETLNDTEFKQLWEIADAFPSELVESEEFGEVPKGWETTTIGDAYDVQMGQSPKGETYNEKGEGILFYQGRAEFNWRFPSPRLFTTDPKRIAQKNDILLSVRAPVGDLNVALEKCCIGRGLAALRHKSGFQSFTLYQLQSLEDNLNVFNGEGTVFGSINQKDLKSIKVILPTFNAIKLFQNFVESIDKEIEINELNSLKLSETRDLLSPKLLNGEI